MCSSDLVKGAAELVREEMIQLAAAVLQAPPEAIELADGFARIKDGPEEAALPFMALGAIINANNAFLPPEFNPTLHDKGILSMARGDDPARHMESWADAAPRPPADRAARARRPGRA